MLENPHIEAFIQETQKHLERFWENYTRLGGCDMDWFKNNIGPLIRLPTCSDAAKVTYEYKDAKGNWSKPWVVKR